MTSAMCLMSDPADFLEALHQFRDQIHRMECEDLGVPRPPCTNDDCGDGIRNQEDPQ